MVFLNFFFQTRMERPGVGAGFGNFGPYSSLQIQTSVRNPEDVTEGFFWLANLVSNPDVVSLQTSIFGPGSSRAATLKFEIEEKKGVLRMKADVKDKALALNLSVVAEGPTAAFANRFGGNNLSRSRFQNQDNAALANSQALFVVQGDNAGSQPADNVELSTDRTAAAGRRPPCHRGRRLHFSSQCGAHLPNPLSLPGSDTLERVTAAEGPAVEALGRDRGGAVAGRRGLRLQDERARQPAQFTGVRVRSLPQVGFRSDMNALKTAVWRIGSKQVSRENAG